MSELRQARASGRNTPDFFIVGHAKCGTTALYRMLKAHPQIYMPVFKETQFLSRAPHERVDKPRRRAPVRPQKLEQYLSLFEAAQPGQRAGEASTEYLRTPATACRIAALRPDARIVAIFREPTSFLRSFHLQLLQVNVETERDFERAIDLEQQRRRGRHLPRGIQWPPALMYSQHVRYVDQLRGYHGRFGRERVLALIYDDFRADNEGIVRQVLRFLDVDDSYEIEPTEVNPTVRVRSHGAEELIRRVSVGEGTLSLVAKRTLKGATSERLRRQALATVKRMVFDADPPAPSGDFMAKLRRRFKSEVVAASEYLERDLVSLWGYDDVR